MNEQPHLSKTCNSCGKEYPATPEFWYSQKTGKYGLRAGCKSCRLIYQRNWQKANPEKVREKSRRWRLTHPDYAKKWRLAHPDYFRLWRLNRKDNL